MGELVEEGSDKMDVRNKDEVISRMKAAVASKQFGQEDMLCNLIADVNGLCSSIFLISVSLKVLVVIIFLTCFNYLCSIGVHPSVSKEPCNLQCR